MATDLERFRETYIIECFELLADMEDRLLGLDEGSQDTEALNAIFRCAHSIKGGAGAFGFMQITQFTHILETLLDAMREGKLLASRDIINLLLQSRDIMLHMVTAAKENTPLEPDFGKDIAEQLQALCNSNSNQTSAPAAKRSVEIVCSTTDYDIRFTPHPTLLAHGNEPLNILRELATLGQAEIRCDTSRVPGLAELDPEQCYLSWQIALKTDKGEAAIREVFEFVELECDLQITAKQESLAVNTPSIAAPAAGKQPFIAPDAPIQTATTSIRVDIDKVDRLINMVGEVVITQAMLAAQTRTLISPEFSELLRGISELSQHTRELQEAVMSIRMQPVKSIFSRMPRIVRDLSQQLGKDIKLFTSGEDTEVDKTIIEQLSDPLTHMIRNSIDHGIESPQKRAEIGKPAQGTIHLSASQRGGKIIIEVQDDGGGINRERVLAKAMERGLIAPNASLSDEEIDMLIFSPGFSTAEIVSNVSGRGVGMDVVKRNIENIGGSVTIHSTTGQGSVFTISLPLTLAILDGMIVRLGNEHYIIPIANIIETLRPRAEEVRQIAGGGTVINVRGSYVPVLYLYKTFGTANAVQSASEGLVVLVESGTMVVGLVVDELIGQQQVVIKTLEENSDPIAGVGGATILGDGKVSLILDIAGLCRMSFKTDQPVTEAA